MNLFNLFKFNRKPSEMMSKDEMFKTYNVWTRFLNSPNFVGLYEESFMHNLKNNASLPMKVNDALEPFWQYVNAHTNYNEVPRFVINLYVGDLTKYRDMIYDIHHEIEMELGE